MTDRLSMRGPHTPNTAPPPPYESALYRQLWTIVAPYVQPQDLYSACLVSRQFHKIFAPLLWKDPGSRFGNDSDSVYLSITRFKRLLLRARLDVRKLTQALHIPSASPEFYGGPSPGWLRDILDRLPSLQALIVSNLAFFDHQALQTIHQRNETPDSDTTKYGLRLLIASECENTTAASLATALLHFPGLIYLDLSSTQGSRNSSVLNQIGTLSQLRVLKLRNCGLRDHDISLISFSSRLLSLDVSDNYLTEKGVSSLVERLPAATFHSTRHETVPLTRDHRIPPKRRPTLQSFVSNKLTNELNGHLYLEDGLPPTFADLYLAGNFLTIEELSKTLSYPNIEYLDCGSLNCSQRHQDMLSPGSPGADRRRFSAAEIDKISPALFSEAFRNVKSLRIHHSIITSRPFSGKDVPMAEQCFELHSEDLRHELDSREIMSPDMVFELDDTSVKDTGEATDANAPSPVPSTGSTAEPHHTFEPDSADDVGPALSLPPPAQVKDNFADGLIDIYAHLRNNRSSRKRLLPKISITSNPVRVSLAQEDSPSQFRTTTSPFSLPARPETFHYNYTAGEDRRWHEAEQNSSSPTSTEETLNEVIQRRHRIEARERHPGRFKPSLLPNLKTLTLTDVPCMTRRQGVIDSLISFIQECAEEEEMARLEYLDKPQGNDKSAKGIFKLQRLVLEMSSTPEPPIAPRSPAGKRNSFTKSSTEDHDSEMFMEASETDFSFFGEDDGGLIVSDGRIDAPMRVDDGMIVNNFLGSPTDQRQAKDVVSELAGFRRGEKAKHEAAVEFGGCSIDTALIGHWRGEVKVVKNYLGA